jgi:hypothetical protein
LPHGHCCTKVIRCLSQIGDVKIRKNQHRSFLQVMGRSREIGCMGSRLPVSAGLPGATALTVLTVWGGLAVARLGLTRQEDRLLPTKPKGIGHMTTNWNWLQGSVCRLPADGGRVRGRDAACERRGPVPVEAVPRPRRRRLRLLLGAEPGDLLRDPDGGSGDGCPGAGRVDRQHRQHVGAPGDRRATPSSAYSLAKGGPILASSRGLDALSSWYAAFLDDDDAGHLRCTAAAALTSRQPSRSQTPGLRRGCLTPRAPHPREDPDER